MADFDSPFDAVSVLAEVLRGDQEMMSLDIGNLVKRYPDVTHEQLVCLLLLRGDLGRNDARDTASEFVSAEAGGERTRATLHARSILSQVKIRQCRGGHATFSHACSASSRCK